MRLEEIATEIEKKLSLINLKNIKIHLKDFNQNKPAYIEFQLPDRNYEKTFSKISNKLIGMIKKNSPAIYVTYDSPHPHHNTNLRRIIIDVDKSIKSPEKREELLKEAAINFYGILKKWVKYA